MRRCGTWAKHAGVPLRRVRAVEGAGRLFSTSSRTTRAAARATRPAVPDPGTPEQPAAHDDGAGQRQPELHHQPAPLGAPAQPAVLVAPRMGALDHPPAANLDRCRDAPCGDLTDHPPLGQDLPAGLIVIAGVQVDRRPLGQHPNHADGVQVAASSPSSRRLAGAGTAPSGMPPASVRIERFRPCLRRSTGLGPAVWPPQGALVVHPSTARCSSSRPSMRS